MEQSLPRSFILGISGEVRGQTEWYCRKVCFAQRNNLSLSRSENVICAKHKHHCEATSFARKGKRRCLFATETLQMLFCHGVAHLV